MELFFENPTWCTPSDVIEFPARVALDRALWGCRAPCGRTSLDVGPVQNPRSVRTGLRCRQLFQPDEPQDGGWRDVKGGGSLHDRHLGAVLSLSLAIDRDSVVIAK